jgi:hypothetical protein
MKEDPGYFDRLADRIWYYDGKTSWTASRRRRPSSVMSEVQDKLDRGDNPEEFNARRVAQMEGNERLHPRLSRSAV